MSLQKTNKFIAQECAAYNFKAKLSLGEPNTENGLTHPINLSNENSPVSVEVGCLYNGNVCIYPMIASCADDLLNAMEAKVASGDFGDVNKLKLMTTSSGHYQLNISTDCYSASESFDTLETFYYVLENNLNHQVHD